MKIDLCKTNLERYGEDGKKLLEACRARGTVTVKPCLERCMFCQRVALAMIDGQLAGAKDAATLAENLEEVT